MSDSGVGSTEPPESAGAGSAGAGAGDDLKPILPYPGASDYERYLQTDALLALQRSPEEWVHRDELLFMTVHQSSELWLKLACAEVEEATRLIAARELRPALRLLRRAPKCVAYVIGFLAHLEEMSPWEYQTIRKVLGHGSGFDSPGFREVRRVSLPLGEAFHALRRERGLSVAEVYTRAAEDDDLYELAERLTDWDEQIGLWRFRHYKVVARIIGEDVVGTQGTPVELLGGLIKHKLYPELWAVRTELTNLSNSGVGSTEPPGSEGAGSPAP